MQPVVVGTEYYQQILENVNAGVYTTDTRRRIVLWNKGAELITGYAAEEVQGRSCSNSILQHRDKSGAPLCSSDSCPLHRSMIKNEKSTGGMIVSSLTKSGKRIWVKTRVAPLHDKEGTVIGGIEIFEDVSREMAEYEKAKAIQEKLLGDIFSGFNRLKIAHSYVPCDVVGGDLITVDKIDDSVVFSLVDFVGHGLPAALMSSYYKSIVFHALREKTPVQDILPRINREFNDVFNEAYVGTAVLGSVNSLSGEVILYNAGHPAPHIIKKTNGTVQLEAHPAPGFPLGLFFESPEPVELKLDPGMALFFTSDGLLETKGGEGRMLGFDFIAHAAAENGLDSCVEFLDSLLNSAMSVNRDIGFDDDISMLLIKYE